MFPLTTSFPDFAKGMSLPIARGSFRPYSDGNLPVSVSRSAESCNDLVSRIGSKQQHQTTTQLLCNLKTNTNMHDCYSDFVDFMFGLSAALFVTTFDLLFFFCKESTRTDFELREFPVRGSYSAANVFNRLVGKWVELQE